MIICRNIEACLFIKSMSEPHDVSVRTQVSTFGSPFSASGLGSCQLVSPHSKCWGQARPAAGHGFPSSWAGCQLAK